MHARITRTTALAFGFAACSLSLCARPLFADAPRPNFIVFYTDDHGYADLGAYGNVNDIRTPHTDALAAGGVLVRHGYSTAPQCVPSRGGLLVGRFQARFGLESNVSPLDGFNQETTIAERLQEAGYITAQFGKWHLGPTPAIPQHGFRHVFAQNANRPFNANITLDGSDRPMGELENEMYHIDGCSRAAAALIERYCERPFFLYIAWRAPHVPLDAPKKYLDRFPGPMAERRRQALAMISAMDDGVGLIRKTLERHGLTQKTVLFYIGDNGAPLKIHKADLPGGGPGWDGSLNDPLNGEKGMLTEGGIGVPYVVAWPGTIPGGQVYDHPITTLDVAATLAALAGVESRPGDLDGVNLVPYLQGDIQAPPHEVLCWRWISQSAIREGRWKLLRGGQREYLYDLDTDREEQHNLAGEHPEIAARLRATLTDWAEQLAPPGLAVGPMAQTWHDYFDFYLEGKPAPPLQGRFAPGRKARRDAQGWLARNSSLAVHDGTLRFLPEEGPEAKAAFLTCAGLKIAAPATATLSLKTSVGGEAALAWRTAGQNGFRPGNRTAFQVVSSDDWQDCEVRVPAAGVLIHIRVHLPGPADIRRIELRDDSGKTAVLWR